MSPPRPPSRARSPPHDLPYYPTYIDPDEELAWAIEYEEVAEPDRRNCNVSPRRPRPPPNGLQGPISISASPS
ncbi:hypothetical protein BG015_008944, partial [Linnemannia schmuckeri]